MTVGELRAALAGVSEDVQVKIFTNDSIAGCVFAEGGHLEGTLDYKLIVNLNATPIYKQEIFAIATSRWPVYSNLFRPSKGGA